MGLGEPARLALVEAITGRAVTPLLAVRANHANVKERTRSALVDRLVATIAGVVCVIAKDPQRLGLEEIARFSRILACAIHAPQRPPIRALSLEISASVSCRYCHIVPPSLV
jgi:hypothetical protein